MCDGHTDAALLDGDSDRDATTMLDAHADADICTISDSNESTADEHAAADRYSGPAADLDAATTAGDGNLHASPDADTGTDGDGDSADARAGAIAGAFANDTSGGSHTGAVAKTVKKGRDGEPAYSAMWSDLTTPLSAKIKTLC